jgi:hypothetical protein
MNEQERLISRALHEPTIARLSDAFAEDVLRQIGMGVTDAREDWLESMLVIFAILALSGSCAWVLMSTRLPILALDHMGEIYETPWMFWSLLALVFSFALSRRLMASVFSERESRAESD